MFLTTCPTASARLRHTSFWGRGREVGKDYRASGGDGSLGGAYQHSPEALHRKRAPWKRCLGWDGRRPAWSALRRLSRFLKRNGFEEKGKGGGRWGARVDNGSSG